jgi:plastocyanin
MTFNKCSVNRNPETEIAMAKKRKVNKSQAVRDYLKTHPKAMSGEIAAALNKEGIKITPNYAANLKSTLNKTRTAKKVAKAVAAVPVSSEPVVAEKKAGDTVTFEQIRAVTQTVKTVGGFARLHELLGLVKEVGGLKKMKELLEAMSVPETDAIPF